jgi:2-polyprenyl-6-hydroxyphenyl methylase/3-demethylubiquinone-9 3-methyltransferase
MRRALGPLEPAAIRTYRGAFIDLGSLAVTIASVAPNAKRILEIGCGDGVLAEAIREVLPRSQFVGIDPGMDDPGRMFGGDRSDVEFRPVTTTDLIKEGVAPFDLVVICDVLHHVAEGQRDVLLFDAAELTAPGGTVAVKDWELRKGFGSSVAYYADRYISGDRTVRFMPLTEIDELIDAAMPGWPRTCEARIPPRRANVLVTLRRP